jgi:NAD(P)-dependent dehydrogenase (short-subunit alcohol dehydrogenase family)
MDLEINGKKALLTGSSKGIGYAIAHRLAMEGCNLVLIARSSAELEEAAQKIRQESAREVEILAMDLADRHAARKIVQAHPWVDILVNNAGAIPRGSLEQLSDEVVREAWDVKVYGYIDMCRHYMPIMRKKREGVILNVVGAAGEMNDPNYFAGSVGNAALIALTKTLGSTSIEDGVRVVGVNPGPVLTERTIQSMQKRAADRLGDANRWPEIAARMPSGRAATVDEVAAISALLCSPLSSYTSGSLINIDGGLSNRCPVM